MNGHPSAESGLEELQSGFGKVKINEQVKIIRDWFLNWKRSISYILMGVTKMLKMLFPRLCACAKLQK